MSKQEFYKYLGLTKHEEEHLEVTTITDFSYEEFELYKRQHEKENKKVYKVLFYLPSWSEEKVFAYSAKVEHGDYDTKDLMDAFIKKWRNEEEVVYKFVGKARFCVNNKSPENASKLSAPYTVTEDFCFENVVKGYVSKFEIDVEERTYKIYLSGNIVSMKLEHNYENGERCPIL
jgi:hypothetical protein